MNFDGTSGGRARISLGGRSSLVLSRDAVLLRAAAERSARDAERRMTAGATLVQSCWRRHIAASRVAAAATSDLEGKLGDISRVRAMLPAAQATRFALPLAAATLIARAFAFATPSARARLAGDFAAAQLPSGSALPPLAALAAKDGAAFAALAALACGALLASSPLAGESLASALTSPAVLESAGASSAVAAALAARAARRILLTRDGARAEAKAAVERVTAVGGGGIPGGDIFFILATRGLTSSAGQDATAVLAFAPIFARTVLVAPGACACNGAAADAVRAAFLGDSIVSSAVLAACAPEGGAAAPWPPVAAGLALASIAAHYQTAIGAGVEPQLVVKTILRLLAVSPLALFSFSRLYAAISSTGAGAGVGGDASGNNASSSSAHDADGEGDNANEEALELSAESSPSLSLLLVRRRADERLALDITAGRADATANSASTATANAIATAAANN